jgi:sarcosine oxidase
MTSYDVIVLGIGGYGSAACYHAARRGATVLGLEQFTPAHDRGSSHGETRIIRQAYFEHADYVPLLLRAYELWRDLEHETGRQLLTPAGLVISGPPELTAVSGTKRAARQHGLPLEELTAAEAQRRFPQFRFPPDHQVVFEAAAGYLAVEECMRSCIEQAERHGADLRFQTPVLSWESDERTVIVRTEREEFFGRSLIVAAGPWAARCLDGLSVPLGVVRKFLAWFPVRPEFRDLARRGPTFFFEMGERQFYGFPSLDGQTLKMAEHTGGRTVDDPSEVDRSQSLDDVAPLAAFLKECLPAVDPTPLRHSVCMYTLTPDRHFIIDRHPHFANVALACGFSGHGYKFVSVLGDVLAELALTGRTSAPIGFLRIDRPELKA